MWRRHCKGKHLSIIVFDKRLWPSPPHKAFCSGQAPCLPLCGILQGSNLMGQLITVPWEGGFKRAPALFCSLWWLLWAYKLIFQGCCVAGEHGAGVGQVKTPQSSLVLPRSSHFSSICAPQVASSLGLIFRVLKRWFWEFFCQLLYCFYGEKSFWRSLPFLLTPSSSYFLDENFFWQLL